MTKWLFFLRSFFPSWIFFDRTGGFLELEVRFGPTHEALGPWRPALNPIDRGGRRLFIHPKGNLRHFHQTLLAELQQDLSRPRVTSGIDVAKLKTYQLVQTVTQKNLPRDANGQLPLLFQFRLIAVEGIEYDQRTAFLTSSIEESF